MSRIGKNPVNIPAGVDAIIGGDAITVKGSLGTLSHPASKLVNVKREGDTVVFEAADKSKAANAMSGTLRALVANMVTGVSSGFEKS
jgi:large subunit ribosomal protein L6